MDDGAFEGGGEFFGLLVAGDGFRGAAGPVEHFAEQVVGTGLLGKALDEAAGGVDGFGVAA